MEDHMHRTTINVPEAVFQQARIKAFQENVAVSEVIRDLLARWVAGEIELSSEEEVRENRIALARSAHGMWADRDADGWLATSRAGLKDRDKELGDARLAF
jgi:hypothetical protein